MIPGTGSMHGAKLKTIILLLIMTLTGCLSFISPGIFIPLIAVFFGFGQVPMCHAGDQKTMRKRGP
jgi:hypothetical protein